MISELWHSDDGKLDRDGDLPAFRKIEAADGREWEILEWYRDGKCHRDERPAKIVTDLTTGVVVQEIFMRDDLTHRDGDEKPAFVSRHRDTGKPLEIAFFTDGVEDRATGPAVMRFDMKSGKLKIAEYWRRGRRFDPKPSSDTDEPVP